MWEGGANKAASRAFVLETERAVRPFLRGAEVGRLSEPPVAGVEVGRLRAATWPLRERPHRAVPPRVLQAVRRIPPIGLVPEVTWLA